jgi:AraC family transcriptional regulator of adaptative response/methylated-DNA-[protein]-cysteine methyltransferase
MHEDFESCLRAVQSKDGRFDGWFFTGVRTTGIYCRPSCPAVPPKPRNIRFYPSAAAAQAAGFRACKRCRPTEGSQAERHIAAVERACALIRKSDALPSLDEMASAAGISRYHFHRVFKQITGATPREWGKAHRMDRFAARLDAGENVAEAVYAAGFGASSRAYEAAPSGLGMTPAARRHGGRGETIRFTCVKTTLGWALVAATERGICMTALGDDKAPLEADLRRRFPAALIWPADSKLAGWAERIVRFVTAPGEQPDLPLDIRGTAFQARVWRALQKVPPGKTSTYSEIAAALGQPKAVRAVAAACAANKLALLVPCHRIVGKSGDLTGYRWGVERKRALLAAEHEVTATDAAAE